jgi:hypothetical protein
MRPADKPKPWLKQPGEVVDKKGVPIYPGDLLRSYHFRAARRREVYYLYHVATYQNGAMHMTPAHWLEPSAPRNGGECLLSDGLAIIAEVIAGTGPGDLLDHRDRPKRRRGE